MANRSNAIEGSRKRGRRRGRKLSGQIYFGFEVDGKLLPFAIEEFGDQCWVYGSDILHGDRLYGAMDVFLKRDDISEESKRKLLVDNTAKMYVGFSQRSGN